MELTGDRAEGAGGARFQLGLEIGAVPIVLRCDNARFLAMLQARYANFSRPIFNRENQGEPGLAGSIRLDLTLVDPSSMKVDDDELVVRLEAGRWVMRRGDFRAIWDPASRRGLVRQAAYPYAIDSVMRIILGLTLARCGGFLLHSASAVRGRHAFLFSGVSGSGKTTIARLAPKDSTLLSDEISCVRRMRGGYHAFGTPFTGDLGISGEAIQAPIGALYFLRQGPRNRIEPLDPAMAAAMLLRNILFFTDDQALVERIFEAACDFTKRVRVAELTFRPDPSLWELIA